MIKAFSLMIILFNLLTLYGYRQEKIDVGYYWDLKGYEVIWIIRIKGSLLFIII